MFHHIIIPVDGSTPSRRAVDIGSDIAEKYRARITLVHVMRERELGPELERFAQIEHMEKTTDAEYFELVGREILQEARRIARARGVEQVDIHMDVGDAAKAILRTQEQVGGDCIVMGSRGLKPFDSILLGDIASEVEHEAKCTVISIK